MKSTISIIGLMLVTMFISGTTFAGTERDLLIEQGKKAYLIYCSNCHGQDATGNGPMATLLKVPPVDLTIIRKEGMSEFPFEQVYFGIDGRTKVKTHGAKEMPIWGDAFGGMRAILINQIVHYLETQQKHK